MTADTLEARIQRLEDRNEIIDVVIAYATSIDDGDWAGFANLMTDRCTWTSPKQGFRQRISLASGSLVSPPPGWTAGPPAST